MNFRAMSTNIQSNLRYDDLATQARQWALPPPCSTRPPRRWVNARMGPVWLLYRILSGG